MSVIRIWHTAAVATALLLTGPQLEAQIPLSPRALGMGGAYTATARGFESIFFNPANLALRDGPAWSVAFPQVTVGSSVLGPSVGDLPDFIDFDSLDEARRQELLGLVPENGTAVDLVVRAPVAAVQVGRIGVGLSYTMLGEHTVGKDLIELFFEGYESGRTDYRVGNTVGTRASFWDLAAGYGHEVGPLTLGATAHLYRGGNLVRTQAFDPDPTLLQFGRVEVEYAGVYSRGASGYGLDIGAAYRVMPGLTLSGALANAVSSLRWDEELVGRRVLLTNEDFQNSNFMDLEDRWKASEQELGESPPGRYGRISSDLGRDAWDLSPTVRLGAAWQPLPGTELGLSYHSARRGENEGLLGGRWDDLLGVGVQQRIPFVTLRLGASTNLDEGSIIGGGVRLGVLDLALARFTTAGILADADRNGWAASMSVNVRPTASLR